MTLALRILQPTTVLLIGCTLIYLGAPRFISSIVTLPSRPIITQIQNEEAVSAQSLDILIASQKRGLDWHQSARLWTDLGLAQLLYANKHTKPERQLLLAQAEESLINGLSIGPSNAFAWARLAYIELIKNGPSANMIEKLRLSSTRAPYDRRLVFSRLHLYLLVWGKLNRPDKAVVLEQIRLAWHTDRQRLVKLAIDSKRLLLARAALITDAGQLTIFDDVARHQLSMRKKQ